ncbi:MAG: hypothetical protein WA945_04650 [Arcobacteraceae bacterium]
MNNELELNRLRNINTKSLAATINVTENMAGKYKRAPWEYDIPTSKSVAIERKFDIPVEFWVNIKSFITDNSISKQSTSLVQKKQMSSDNNFAGEII